MRGGYVDKLLVEVQYVLYLHTGNLYRRWVIPIETKTTYRRHLHYTQASFTHISVIIPVIILYDCIAVQDRSIPSSLVRDSSRLRDLQQREVWGGGMTVRGGRTSDVPSWIMLAGCKNITIPDPKSIVS